MYSSISKFPKLCSTIFEQLELISSLLKYDILREKGLLKLECSLKKKSLFLAKWKKYDFSESYCNGYLLDAVIRFLYCKQVSLFYVCEA